jgi:hypothetical protein
MCESAVQGICEVQGIDRISNASKIKRCWFNHDVRRFVLVVMLVEEFKSTVMPLSWS